MFVCFLLLEKNPTEPDHVATKASVWCLVKGTALGVAAEVVCSTVHLLIVKGVLHQSQNQKEEKGCKRRNTDKIGPQTWFTGRRRCPSWTGRVGSNVVPALQQRRGRAAVELHPHERHCQTLGP